MKRVEHAHSEDPNSRVSSLLTPPYRGGYEGGDEQEKGYDYDVFLSCGGKDTRRGFTDYLYMSLVDSGIRVFRNNNELPVGEKLSPELLHAIMQCKISIPIISTDYTSSKWCLHELAQILKCKRSGRQIVLPIFYKVDPSKMQHLSKRFGYAIKEEDEMVVKEWKEALQEISWLKGWESEKIDNGHEGALVKVVVRQVISELRTIKLIDAKELVGIDDLVEKIMSSIDPKFNDMRIIGIHGVSGSGKTTLARVLYNNISSQFDHICFLENIRETSLRMGIHGLKKQLISDLLRFSMSYKMSNDDEGLNLIRDRFSSMKVLIVLDDIDDCEHFHDLVGNRNSFRAGSIVIITTTNDKILDEVEVEVDHRHLLNELTQQQSLSLFSRHIFGEDSPPADYKAISCEIISAIVKVPRALVAIGSSFRRKREEIWKDILEKLKKDVEGNEDKELLTITYKTLYDESQQIFLDIACFFIGSSKQIPAYMWDECGFFPEKGIEILSQMKLIKVDEGGKLVMENQLRDFGREIVCLENQGKPQERSRLWICEEAVDVIGSNKGTRNIEALHLGDSPRSYTGEQFKRLTNLRFLKVHGANFTGNFQDSLQELKWLQWEHCPSDFTATNFHPKQLVILNLSWGGISEDWEGWGPLKMATKLKVLNLTGCLFLRRTPHLSTFHSLEILILEKCENLEMIHPSIGDIKTLISLNVGSCRRMEELPIGVGRLENLRELLINDTAIREIPILEGGLMKLKTLHASCCWRLEKLPTEVGRMKELRELLINDTAIQKIPLGGGLMKLEKLHVSGCKKLEELPEVVCRMEELKELFINDTVIRDIPISRDGLMKLKTLCASYCEKLTQLSETMSSLTSLTQLDLSHSGIEKLPESMVFLRSLALLDLSYSWIEELPKSLDSLTSLTKLDLSHSGIREFPKSMGSLKSLTWLNLSHSGIEELPEIVGSLQSLTYLNLSYLGIKILPKSMGKLVKLTELNLSYLWIEELPESINSLKELEILDASNCASLVHISIGELASLSLLNLSKCNKLAQLPNSIGSLLSLKQLLLQECYLLRQIPDSIEMLASLIELDLRSTAIEKLPHHIQNLKNLKTLDIRGTKITRLPYQFHDSAKCDPEVRWEWL